MLDSAAFPPVGFDALPEALALWVTYACKQCIPQQRKTMIVFDLDHITSLASQ